MSIRTRKLIGAVALLVLVSVWRAGHLFQLVLADGVTFSRDC